MILDKATNKTTIIDPKKPKTYEIKKKWKGVTLEYVEWRYQFIEYVHRIDHSKTQKALILKRLLDFENGTRDVRILHSPTNSEANLWPVFFYSTKELPSKKSISATT